MLVTAKNQMAVMHSGPDFVGLLTTEQKLLVLWKSLQQHLVTSKSGLFHFTPLIPRFPKEVSPGFKVSLQHIVQVSKESHSFDPVAAPPDNLVSEVSSIYSDWEQMVLSVAWSSLFWDLNNLTC